MSAPLILGSASPRRRDILASLGIPFVVRSGTVDETPLGNEEPSHYLERIAPAKLASVGRSVSDSGETCSGVLAADTIVVLDGEILGKPRDVAHAEEILSRIVGRTHVVMTRYAISVAPDVATARVERTVLTEVTMRAVTPVEVRKYATTGEGLDKAGAYAAQGIGAFLISRIAGSFTNVVGLPACEVVEDLLALGQLEGFPLSGARLGG